MKRYPSIDFLRGLAIFLMVYLHTFMRWFDRDTFIDIAFNEGVPLFFIILLVLSLFFGSWAGFFLMVSAMGNMISMYKGLEKGNTVKQLVLKQIIGGILLLVFAYLTEGIIGYHGALGDFVESGSWSWDIFWTRGYHMETIHAVAWCVILNGIVQGLLSINGGWKKIKRNIKIYAILAILVIVATQFVWWGFDALVDGNFSVGNDPLTGTRWQRGDWRILPWYENILRIFWQPWAGEVEPLFPFLSVSFIGSILGLYLMKRKDEPENTDTSWLKKVILIGALMLIIGAILVLVFALTSGADPIDFILDLLTNAFNITRLEDLYPLASGFNPVWLPYFIFITGSQLGAIALIIRLVEFRGKGKKFAEKTIFFRRFGFVAFSIYNYQFIDVLPAFLLGLLPMFPTYSGLYTFNVWQIWFLLIGIFLLWYIVLKLWEKANYAFGLEWCIAKLSEIFIPVKRAEKGERLLWWKTKRLDPQASLYDAEWIDIIEEDKIDHNNLKESKLSQKLALCGIIFFPCFFLAINIAKGAEKSEGKNKYNSRGKIIGIIGAIIFIALIVALAIIPSSILF
ncbi:MAG: hypothetical protein GF364_17620 [Candidatus Lokiarchaeota archaeon]|nr:hypothetical protein [Candidatus Lokiarchaeota archaeon]